MVRGTREIKIIYAAIVLFFGIFLVFPGIMMALEIFRDGNIGQVLYRVFSENEFGEAFLNSITVSIFSALITVMLAFVLAYSVHFTNIPPFVKSIIKVLSVFPMLLPTMTYGFGIMYSFGEQGLITKILGRQFFDIYGFNGLVIGYVIYTLPIAFLLISNTLNYVDKNFIIVSKLMGDSPLRSFGVTIIRPIVGTLGAAFVQSFFLSFTDFGIPSAIGGAYRVVATSLYGTMLGAVPDFAGGAIIAITMLLPSILSIVLLTWLDKFNFRYDKVTKVVIKKNKMRDVLWSLIALCIIGFMLSIFLVIFIVPFAKMWPYRLDFTMENFNRILGDAKIIDIYKNSILVALATAVIGTLIAYGGALVTERSNLSKRVAGVISSFALVINTVPGMVLGLAFLFAFSGGGLQNTVVILVICNIIHFYSTPYLMMKNSLSKMNGSWETTAMLMGDSWLKTIVRVVTPNAKNTILEVLEYYFINSMVTISAIIFLTSAKTMVMTSKIKELQYMAKFDEIFVYSILILATNLIVKVIVKIITGRKKGERNED
ncbi:MAG: ABC transporter permease subunit [Anaerovoracaceae bacterium]